MQINNWTLRESATGSFKGTIISTADELDLPFFIYTFGRTARERNIYWKSDRCILLYSENGCGKALIDGVWHSLPQGSLMYCPSSVEVEYGPSEDLPWTTVYFTITGRNTLSMLGTQLRIVTDCDLTFISSVAEGLRNKLKRSSDRNTPHLMLYELMLKVRHHTKTLTEEKGYKTNADKIKLSLTYIMNNFSQDLPLSMLAEKCDVSEEYYCYLFKEATGTTPTAYINALKISRACDLLQKYPEKPVKEICSLCGFNDPCYFNRVFKRDVGMTPTQFKAQNKG